MSKLPKIFHIVGIVFLVLVLLMTVIGAARRNIYDPKLGINLLLIGKDGMGIVSIRPETGLVSLLRLPDNLSIPVGENGGEYQVGAIYKIGLPLADPNNVAGINVGQALGVVLGGVVKSSVEFGLPGVREALFSLATKTNLSLVDRYLLLRDVNVLLGKKISLTVTLPKSVMDSADEPDGKTIYRLNPAVFVWSRNQWVVDEVLSETAEVTVVNATGKEGQARQVARQIESAGIRVIDVLAAKKQVNDDCLLWGDIKVHPRTAEFLMNSFLCKRETKKNLADYVERNVKSDLVVVLGGE